MPFLHSLECGRQNPKTYTFSEMSNVVPTTADVCKETEKSVFNERYAVNDSVLLQYDSEFYGDLESLIFSDHSLTAGSSVQFPSDYPI